MFDEHVVMDTPKNHDDGNTWCHLAAKNKILLHTFAYQIGLKREWFQDKPGMPHYDIRSTRIRDRAKAMGAVLVDRKYLVNYIRYHNTFLKS